MLSIAKVSTGASAVSYYEAADDYYSHDRSPSRWMGDGAGRLGLFGEVDAQAFRELLDGKLPDGGQIHHAAECRRGGTDFTFSAPKSISMQALIAGDVRLIEAHEAAVSRALEYAQDLAAYRATEAGVTRAEASCNLLVASFRHDLSRDADPQLHTHAVVINATQRPDGEWRALEQGEFYRQQKLMGALYRAELGLAVQKLGYELRMTHSDGRFELAHFSQQQIDAFSTRSRAIEAALAKEGKTRGEASAREKEIAALTTRNGKGELDRTALREAWRLKSVEIGIDFSPPLQPKIPSMEARAGAARDAVAIAVAHVTERQSVVTVPQVVRAALEQGTGSTDRLSIVAEIERQAKAGTLIQVSDRITTPEAQQREREILAAELRGRGAVVPIMDKHRAERTLATTSLNACQRAAAALVVTTDSRISAVQGAAGTGKTTMLAEARRLAEANGYRVVGVAPSAAAARELGKTGIESRTLAAFNCRENPGIDGRSVVILDEAGMVSTRDMRELLLKVEAVGARVILVGDVQQLKAIEAGKPFAQLQAAGVARVEMGEIQRQHDAELRRAVELAAKGEVERSMAVLSRQVVEIENHQDRHLAIARGYATLPAGDRDRSLILAGTHVARTAINHNVRSELGLVGRGIVVTNLERKDLTRVQARSSLSYQTGDLIQALKSYHSLGLARGDLARVIDSHAGRVTLERADGQRLEWRPALQTNMTAYRPGERELAVGDVVRLTANDHARGLVNGERATVAEVDQQGGTVTLAMPDGRQITLDADKPMHLDHGYCQTVHAAQGQTADRVLIEADTRSATANESSYYVAISRARESVTIYTDDRGMLPDAMGRQDDKTAALEINSADQGRRADAAEMSY